MKIQLREITIRDLTSNYKDDQEGGVVGFNGLLDIRPPYQREFVYKEAQRNAVIDTVKKNYPLNVMYWAAKKNDENESYEIIDGQQRTVSICQYVNGDFSLNDIYFDNLRDDEQQQILDYKLTVYICSGTESEKLEWFKTINIAGEKLTDQELRNAVYSGTWVTDSKKFFSKRGGPAFVIGGKFLNGESERQHYLESVIKWISENNIEGYMAKNQHKLDSTELRIYFENVMSWVKSLFPTYRKEMKGVQWGFLYNQFNIQTHSATALEVEVAKLMLDEDVTNKKGIYEYILSKNEKYLNIRAFNDKQRREVYEKQNKKCIHCENVFELSEMEADHIDPWHEGGKTSVENCQMLCKPCNRRKSGK